MIQTKVKPNIDITKLFTFNDFAGGEQQVFLADVGTLIFQSALMRYLALYPDSEVEEFENFIASNVNSDSFLDALCLEYPRFEELLVAEMIAFKSEIIS